VILRYVLTNGHRVEERMVSTEGVPISAQEATETLTLLLSGVDSAGRVSALGAAPAIGVRDLDGLRRILMTRNIVEIQVIWEPGDPEDPLE
jgi:hypothetical protein